jgi:hypothetical protein
MAFCQRSGSDMSFFRLPVSQFVAEFIPVSLLESDAGLAIATQLVDTGKRPYRRVYGLWCVYPHPCLTALHRKRDCWRCPVRPRSLFFAVLTNGRINQQQVVSGDICGTDQQYIISSLTRVVLHRTSRRFYSSNILISCP